MQTSKLVTKSDAQGELYLTLVQDIPDGFKPQDRKGPAVVGFSDSGNHHTIDGVTVYEASPRDPLLCYLKVDDTLKEPATLSHPTHPALLLSPGAVVRLKRARESTPDGWQAARD